MRLTLLDEQGVELTEITSKLGQVPGHVNVDWATRPDALFQYYFDRGSRAVTAVTEAASWAALLGTRWQMGARFWFLHTFAPIDVTPAKRTRRWKQSSATGVTGISQLPTQSDVMAGVALNGLTSDARGIPD